MSVMIVIDPHKALHAVCAIDRHEAELAEVVVRSGPRQLDQLLEWASPYASRTWAIESASGLGHHSLRHWCASSMLAESTSITAVAGHLGDTVETVSRTYAHWLRDDRDVPAAVLDRLLAAVREERSDDAL